MGPSSVGGGRILRCTLSVRLSVCPSVPFAEVVFLLFTLQPSYERTSKTEKNFFFDYRPASTLRTCGIFCFVYMCGPHTVGRSAAQACFLYARPFVVCKSRGIAHSFRLRAEKQKGMHFCIVNDLFRHICICE